MQPAAMTASLKTPESELSKKAVAFSDMTQNKGWVVPSSPFALLQKSFFSGASDSSGDAQTYFDKILAKTDRVDLVEGRITRDTDMARSALGELNDEADTFLASDMTATRSDVSGFEEALVAARTSHRAFEAADDILTERRTRKSDLTTRSLKAYDAEIERSKQLADALVASWRSDEIAVS